MSLSPGARLGPFDIVTLIGEGGMGQVYRARDAKLARDVAIKVLPDGVANDPDRLARFRREAQALAALNDQHIAQIYHLEESPSTGGHAGRAALVMEFVEGRTLAEMVSAGVGLPMEDALSIAHQVACGLETAHEKGIVHRDLKPANVKITPQGHAKILDFGLAKAMGAPGSEDPGMQLANSPTLTARATEAGMILGTAAYMSPEQARGKTLDKRTDIWAFGCVLFEMLTGHRAFDGDTVSDTLASVLRSDPEWSRLPADVPMHVRALLARCLERDVTRRLRDIGEARMALGGASHTVAGGPATVAVSTIQLPPSQISAAPAALAAARPWFWIAATAVLFVALGVILPTSSFVRSGGSASRAIESYELAISAPPGTEFQIGSNLGAVNLSPDGTRIAFVATTDKASTLWVRSLAQDDARSIPGTEGAANPFWSPDGHSLAFFAGAKLWTVKVDGGLPEAIAASDIGRGGAWSEDGTILFGQSGRALSRVASTGGTVTAQTTLDLSRKENAHYWPRFLPGGKRFLYFVRSAQVENGGIYLGNMDGSPSVRLVPALSSGLLARHPATGAWYLMWARDQDLLAQTFDVTTGTLSGEVRTIATGVAIEESQRLVYASASDHGHLAWATSRASDNVLALYAHDGRRLRMLDVPPGSLAQPTISPDGNRLLFIRVERGGADVVLHNLTTNATDRVTTSPDYEEFPIWVPDGSGFVFVGRAAGGWALFRQTIGGGDPEEFYKDNSPAVGFEAPGRRYVLVNVSNDASGEDVVARMADGSIVPLLMGPANEGILALSNDGRTVILRQQSGSRSAVLAARVTLEGATVTLGPLQTVTEGSAIASLRSDGREALALMPDGTVKSALLASSDATLSVGAVTTLFQAPKTATELSISPSGQQIVIVESPFAQGQTIRLLTHWETRLK